jgi:hypothetical protein
VHKSTNAVRAIKAQLGTGCTLSHDVDATFKGRDVGHVESDAQSNNAIQNHNNQSITIQHPHPTTVSYKIQQQYPQLWQHPEAIDRTKIADGERFQTEVDIQLLPQCVKRMTSNDYAICAYLCKV